MRNRALADELSRHAGPAWADFAVCRHPANNAVVRLEEPVFSVQDALKAFRLLSSEEALYEWDARELIEMIASTDETLKDWHGWMTERYFSNGSLE